MIRRFLPMLLLVLSTPILAQSGGKSSWIAGATYDATDVKCDLPDSEQMKNIGSKLDGSGMCVFSALEMSARYQGLEQMRGWRDWCANKYPGGGYPSKVDKLLAKWFKVKNIPAIPYAQYEGNDPGPFLALINKTNRMASLTYGYSPRYGGARFIAHMTNAILYGQKYGVILDNNFPGEKNYEWMTTAELVRRTRLSGGGRQGSSWVFVWLTSGAPPPLHPRRDPSLPNIPSPAPAPAPAPVAQKLIYVSSASCRYCVSFERDTLNDVGVAQKLRAYQFEKLDGPEASAYRVRGYPTYILLDGSREVRRGSGYRSPAQFLAWLTGGSE